MKSSKNIHVLSTDKPSRLYLTTHEYIFEKGYALSTDECQNKNIYITSDEEIKEGDWVYSEARNTLFKVKSICNTSAGYLLIEDDVIMPLEINEVDCKKIILTTDQDLIKDGIQVIDDEFLEWFVKNSSCEEVEVKITDRDDNGYGIPFGGIFYNIFIPKEEPKQDFKDIEFTQQGRPETLEEVAEKLIFETISGKYGLESIDEHDQVDGYFDTYLEAFLTLKLKWQQERMYSEEEVKKIAFDFYYDMSHKMNVPKNLISENMTNVDVWFKQFKKK